MRSFSSHANARLLASYSTGQRMIEKAVVIANKTIPSKNILVPKIDPGSESIRPIIITMVDNLLAMPTAGTILLLRVSQL